MTHDIDPLPDVAFLADRERFPAVVDGAGEQPLESEAEGDGAGARHAGADDLEFPRGVERAGGVVAHSFVLELGGGAMERGFFFKITNRAC